MRELKANTQVKVVIGPFVDVGDGFTPETGIALGTADEAEIMKHDASSVTDISGATWAAIANMDGYYNLTLTTSHTDTEGMLVVAIQDDSVCLPVRAEFMVLSEAAYDSKYAAKDTGYMDVNIKAVSEDTAAADNLELACDNYSATRGLSGTALPAAAADGVGGLPISDAGGLDLDTKLANTNEITAARMGALTDWINGGRLDLILDELTTQGDTNEGKIDTIDTNVDAILVDTNELQADWTNAGRLDAILDSILAMLDNARGEPGDTAPPVNPDAMTKLDYLYKFMRNKIETTATKIHVYDDAGTNKDHTSTISDDGTTFTRGEFAAGDA